MTYQILKDFAPLAGRYQGFLIDVWGVLYDGGKLFPGVLDALAKMKSQNAIIVFLSNSPQRSSVVGDRLRAIGLGDDLYDGILTSGESVYQSLQKADHLHGQKIYCLGQLDTTWLTCIPTDRYELVQTPDLADMILVSEIYETQQDLDAVAALLPPLVAKGLPMICPNPDLVVQHNGHAHFCPGALAARYEDLGGKVEYHGKPHAPIYDGALEILGIEDRRTVLGIGDGLHTDIAGANAAGIDSVLITGGIHNQDVSTGWGQMPDPAQTQNLLSRQPHQPTYVIPALR
jgi:HAD superfamily hydrolase (TIGR01459 family)